MQRSGDVLNSDNNRQQGIRGLPLYIVKHLKFLRNDAYSRLRYIRRKFKPFLIIPKDAPPENVTVILVPCN